MEPTTSWWQRTWARVLALLTLLATVGAIVSAATDVLDLRTDSTSDGEAAVAVPPRSTETPVPDSGSASFRISTTSTNYFFLGARPIVVAPDNPHNELAADLQSGPGSVQSRGSTDFAPVQGDGPCRQATPWTRNAIPWGRGTAVDFCVRLAAMRPMKFFKVRIVVDNLGMASMTFSES